MHKYKKSRSSLDTKEIKEAKITDKFYRHASKDQKETVFASKESRPTYLNHYESQKSQEKPKEPVRPDGRWSKLLYEEETEQVNEHKRYQN